MPHLLIVDSEPDAWSHLKECLRSAELNVSTSHTAREAMQFVAEQAPDVVLMDVSLPDLSGLEAYNRMREKSPALPVIIMTAFATTDTAVEAMKLGAFDYFIKPVDVPRLRSVVARALEVTRLTRAAGELIGVVGSTRAPAAKPIAGQSAALLPGSATLQPARGEAADDETSFPGLVSLARDLLRHNPGSVYRRLSNAVDRIAIREALRYAKGNQLQAAAMLGISRTTLRAKLRSLGLSVEKQLSSDGHSK